MATFAKRHFEVVLPTTFLERHAKASGTPLISAKQRYFTLKIGLWEPTNNRRAGWWEKTPSSVPKGFLACEHERLCYLPPQRFDQRALLPYTSGITAETCESRSTLLGNTLRWFRGECPEIELSEPVQNILEWAMHLHRIGERTITAVAPSARTYCASE